MKAAPAAQIDRTNRNGAWAMVAVREKDWDARFCAPILKSPDADFDEKQDTCPDWPPCAVRQSEDQRHPASQAECCFAPLAAFRRFVQGIDAG